MLIFKIIRFDSNFFASKVLSIAISAFISINCSHNANAFSKIDIFMAENCEDAYLADLILKRFKGYCCNEIEIHDLEDKDSYPYWDNYHRIVLVGKKAINQVYRIELTKCRVIAAYSSNFNEETLISLTKIAQKKNKSIIYIFASSKQKKFLDDYSSKLPANIIIKISPFVVNSLDVTDKLKQEAIEGFDLAKNLFQNTTIHLGGTFVTSYQDSIRLSNDEYREAISKLNINTTQPISIILHPRFFLEHKRADGSYNSSRAMQIINVIGNQISKGKACSSHKNKTNTDLITFYCQENILNKIDIVNSRYNIKPCPSYDSMIHILNEYASRDQDFANYFIAGKQYVSGDLYASFAKIKTVLFPFLLDPNNQVQQDYTNSYNSEVLVRRGKMGRYNLIDQIVVVVAES